MGTHAKTVNQEYENINRKTARCTGIQKWFFLNRFGDCTNKMNLNSRVTNAERINPISTYPPRNVQISFVPLCKCPFKCRTQKKSFLILYLTRMIKQTTIPLLINKKKTIMWCQRSLWQPQPHVRGSLPGQSK